ncbi:MAG: tetratricopeptide repeat protein [Candidatus Korobacteraceae bacterium]|jgi:tetratricopeptide (TPR) repeat protein
MKKYFNLAGVLLILGMCAFPLWGQITGTITGVAKDQNGKPIVGATVELVNDSTGTKYVLKTNAKGAYYSVGISLGTYTVTLLQNGKPIDQHGNAVIEAAGERSVDFDLAKDAAMAAEKATANQKDNEKIKGLNATLKQAKELEGAGNYDQAVSLLQQATQVDPNQDLVWGYLGDAQRGAGAHATDPQVRAKNYQDAVASYQKALAIKPTSGAYMGQLAEAYARSGETDKAVEQYAAAAQADPQNAGAYYYNEGAVLTNTNKFDEAIAAFDKAIQIDPTRADAYYWKGNDLMNKATIKDNKVVAAPGTAEAFNKYLELQPNGKFADNAKQMLAAIGAPVETSYGKPKPSKKPN